MMKKVSLAESKCITYFVNGTGWLAYGFFKLFDNSICSTIASVFLLICIVLSVVVPMTSKECDDEMSIYNMMRAKAVAMDWLKIIMCLVMLFILILVVLQKRFPSVNAITDISVVLIAPLILGITEILIGSLFARYEKDGE